MGMKPKITITDHPNLISVFRAHIGDITGIAWHQSGKYLLSSSKDKYIHVWENPTLSQISATAIVSAKTKDGGYFSALRTIVTPNYVPQEGTKINDDDQKEEIEDPFASYSDAHNAVFASTNGSFGLNSYKLKMAPLAKKIRLPMTSNTQTEFFKEDVKCLCVPESMAFIGVSGSHNTKMYFYDIKQKQRMQRNKIKKLKIPQAPANKSDMRTIEKNVDKAMEVVDGGQFINYEMNISFDGKWLSIGSFKKDIRLWQVNYLKPGKRDVIKEHRFGGLQLLCSLINVHEKPVTVVTFSCCSKYMISASKDGCVKVWDIVNCDYERGEKPEMLFESDLGIGAIENLIVDYQYDIAAVLNEERRCVFIYKFKYEKKKIKLHLKIENVVCKEKDADKRINCVRFSPDSQYIAVGSNDFDVRVYDITKKTAK